MNLTEKLSAIQQKIKAPKNLYNRFGNYNYRNAESILEAFKPYASEYKTSLTVTDDIVIIGNRVYVKAIATLMDCESSETICSTAFAREPESKKGMDESQVTGAASSYARKYALNGLFLLDDTKDADTDENRMESEKKSEKGKERKALCDALSNELVRCGYTWKSVYKTYKVDNVDGLSDEQIKDCIEKIKKQPDKAVSQ